MATIVSVVLHAPPSIKLQKHPLQDNSFSMLPLDKHPLGDTCLQDTSTLATYADGESVCPSDSLDGYAHFILFGHAEIKRETDGQSELLGALSSGEAFLELSVNEGTACATSTRTTIRAKGELQTILIGPENFHKLTLSVDQADKLVSLLRESYASHDGGQGPSDSELMDDHPVIATSFHDSNMQPVVVRYGKKSVTVQTQQKHEKATPQSLVFIDQEHSIERRLEVIDKRIVSAYLSGTCDETVGIITAIRDQQSLRHAQRVSFENSGLLFGRAKKSDFLCNCMSLTRTQLKSEIHSGCDTFDLLRQATGVATGCGTCLECVQDLIDELTCESTTSNDSLARKEADKKEQLAPDFFSLGLGVAACVVTLIGLSIPLGSEAFHQWQASSAGRWWSGGAFLCFLGYQWWMPIYRWSGGLAKADSLRNAHRRIGACMPLLLLFHNTSYGAGMLSMLTVAVLLHTIIGVADSSLISGQQRQQTYLRVWLFPHILLAFLITVLSLYHVWVILTHGGP